MRPGYRYIDSNTSQILKLHACVGSGIEECKEGENLASVRYQAKQATQLCHVLILMLAQYYYISHQMSMSTKN